MGAQFNPIIQGEYIGQLDLYTELGAMGRDQVSSAGQNVSSPMSFPLSQLFS